ncbi:MAG: PAS domain S-box protein [Hyphomicrobiales bacterium]|nr:PAS domain S-box protein [Hyphomicrobiales bacterium]
MVSGSRLEAILESAVDAIVSIDEAALIETVNPAAERLFQYDRAELIGQNVKMLMPEPFRAEHDAYMQRYRETGIRKIIGVGREVVGQRKDGSTFPMHLSVGEFMMDGERHYTGIIHDLTVRQKAEHALQHSQRMEAIGQLTGGIAHDFNNLLTVVIGNLELLQMRDLDKTQNELVSEAQEAADLGARLTARLLAFARRSHLEPQTVDLNAQVLGLTDLLHRTLGEQINLSSALSTGLWSARADPTQIESAIVNLAVNARDAMARGGKLVIETRNTVFDDDDATTEIGVKPGDYVQLSVSDTGTGMSKEVQERVFEPFFTTKEAGRGTGLGLSMVYGFARQSGGHVTVYSEAGQGTTINLYLPRVDDDAAPAMAVDAGSLLPRGDGQVILVVEDDERVRRLTIRRIGDLGYDVIAAANAAEALDIVGKNSRIDLVFTDIIMPGGMSGYELCDALRADKPDIKVVLTSGYAEDLVHSDRLGEQELMLVRKPYRQTELAKAIKQALDQT